MVIRVHQQLLSEGPEEPSSQLGERYQEILHWPCAGTVRGLRHESFGRQELADLRLDGLLTLILMAYGCLGDLFVLLRYHEQLQGSKREFDAQLETAS